MLIKRWIFYGSDETEITLFLQIFLNILEYVWWYLHSSFLFMGMGERWSKVICVVNEMGYSRKKKHGGFRTYFFEKTTVFFTFSTLPLQTPDKTKLYP